jgi:hypothetical protein
MDPKTPNKKLVAAAIKTAPEDLQRLLRRQMRVIPPALAVKLAKQKPATA